MLSLWQRGAQQAVHLCVFFLILDDMRRRWHLLLVTRPSYEQLKELDCSVVTEEEMDYFLACQALDSYVSSGSDSD